MDGFERQLAGKTAVVTGSGRGIGKAVAWRLAQMGANIVLNGTAASGTAETVCALLKESGFPAAACSGDVSNPDDVKALCKTALDSFGSLDILVNNAGITRDKPLLTMPEEDWDAVLDVNLKGAFLCVKAASKIMIRQRSGKIINVASVAGITGNPGQVNYSASKAGLIGLTKTAAKELAPRGITCNAVAPGFIESDMTGSLPVGLRESYLGRVPLGRFGTPEDVAGVVGFLASGLSGYVTGQVILIDGGLAI
jgi:3-oxoacyl-[acyl-carrier protein] reductase